MSIDASELRRMLRKMEWQVAKGHLEAMLETFGEGDEADLERAAEEIRLFAAWMEDEL